MVNEEWGIFVNTNEKTEAVVYGEVPERKRAESFRFATEKLAIRTTYITKLLNR